MSDTSIQILEFVRQHPDGVRSKEVAERFGDNAPRYLQRLEEKGWLIKLKRGVYAAPEKIPFPED